MRSLKPFVIRALERTMPPRVKRALFHLAFNLDRAEFDRFAYRYAFAPHARLRLIDLNRRGLRPDSIIDVGAFKGDFARLCREVWPEATLVMIEPNDAMIPCLRQVADRVGASVHHALVAEAPGREVDFFVMQSGSSLYEEDSPLPRQKVRKVTATLEQLLESLPTIGLLKLDVQGAELDVLRGLGARLDDVKSVLVECSLIQINRGAPLAHEIVMFLAQRGFVLGDVIELHRRPLDGATNQIDLLFLRPTSPLLADTRHFE